ncbi:hypothetical protein LTR28_007500 [Elasticomyces elasticus]|nr:hypothetical protein LTR28_007500 [Elasticomyces elasticus]
MASIKQQIPGVPRVIPPSPTPSESGSTKDGYFASATRTTASTRLTSPEPIDEDAGEQSSGSDPELKRARPRSRSPHVGRRLEKRRMSGLAAANPKTSLPGAATSKPVRRKAEVKANGGLDGTGDGESAEDGHLKPQSTGFGREYWRQLSRSPSPLGLIPIHREWRKFIHRHEIPRKALHVSIGFLTLQLYLRGAQPSDIHPVLLTLLIPVAATDVFRHKYPPFNRFYIRSLGFLMRESEAHDKYNGVIFYLFGAWACMRFAPKDVGVLSILLLSWCDTAASTFGRLWGRYTPRVRKGKSLAGCLAAFTIGIGTTVLFYEVVASRLSPLFNQGENAFAFNGKLALPAPARDALGVSAKDATIGGPAALGVFSLWAGLVASVSEAVDMFGWDDNLTIPILCGIGIGGFLKAFGSW